MVKAPKDSNAPKKPLTPFFAFRDVHFKRIVKELGGTKIDVGLVSKKVGEEWKELSDAKKTELKETFAKQQKTYQKKFEVYKKTSSYEAHQKVLKEFKEQASKKKNKFKKDENKPKKPATAYFCFMSETRPKVKAANPTLPHKTLVVKMSKMWNELSEDDKKPYVAQAAEKRAVYEKELKAYLESPGFKEYQEAKEAHVQAAKTTKKRKAKKEKKSKSPKKSAKKAKSPRKPKAPKKSAKKAKKTKAAAKAKSPKQPKAPKRKSTRKAAKKARPRGRRGRRGSKQVLRLK